MHAIDLVVQNYILSIRTPLGVELFYLLTNFFNIIPFSLLAICAAIFIYHKKDFLNSVLFMFAIVTAAGTTWVLKRLLNVSRPDISLVLDKDPSLPSGHATLVTVFFLMLMYIFSKSLSGWKKFVFNTFCVSMILLVSFSRLYLSAHWLSDVLAGIAIGTASTFVCIYIFRRVFRLS